MAKLHFSFLRKRDAKLFFLQKRVATAGWPGMVPGGRGSCFKNLLQEIIRVFLRRSNCFIKILEIFYKKCQNFIKICSLSIQNFRKFLKNILLKNISKFAKKLKIHVWVQGIMIGHFDFLKYLGSNVIDSDQIWSDYCYLHIKTIHAN